MSIKVKDVLRRAAEKGLTARDAADIAGVSIHSAHGCANRYGFTFSPCKIGRPNIEDERRVKMSPYVTPEVAAFIREKGRMPG